jgi:hypothetical protein
MIYKLVFLDNNTTLDAKKIIKDNLSFNVRKSGNNLYFSTQYGKDKSKSLLKSRGMRGLDKQ